MSELLMSELPNYPITQLLITLVFINGLYQWSLSMVFINGLYQWSLSRVGGLSGKLNKQPLAT